MLNQKQTILIADDEVNILRTASLVIDTSRYQLITAENGFDAYEKILEHTPDIVFSDILMPKCDGFELCERLKSNDATKDISFILLTNEDEEQFQTRSSDVGADDFLMKPFSAEDIAFKISQWCPEKKQDIITTPSPESDIIIETDPTPQTEPSLFQLGVPELDHQLIDPLKPETFILTKGPINSSTSQLGRQFIRQGLLQQQPSLLLSLSNISTNADPICQISNDEQSFLHLINASNWTSTSSKPWRNLDFIYDQMLEVCSNFPIQRIVIDSISQGFAFWTIPDILQFINLCRSLPNHNSQCLMITQSTHPDSYNFEYHLSHAVDMGITLQFNNNNHFGTIDFYHWHSFNNEPVKIKY